MSKESTFWLCCHRRCSEALGLAVSTWESASESSQVQEGFRDGGPASYPFVVAGLKENTCYIRYELFRRNPLTNTIIYFQTPNSYFSFTLHDRWHFTSVNNIATRVHHWGKYVCFWICYKWSWYQNTTLISMLRIITCSAVDKVTLKFQDVKIHIFWER